jgi:hypothetical protein
MSNVYRFIYDSEMDEGSDNFPQCTQIKARHYVDSASTWVPILFQFCKFLEATGFVGVKDKVVIVDDYNFGYNDIFTTITTEELNKSNFKEMKEDIE